MEGNLNIKEDINIGNKKVSKLCNIAFWFSIASVFLYSIGIIPLIGVILSIIALIKYNKDSQKGLKRGIIGLVLNVLYLLLNAYQNGHI